MAARLTHDSRWSLAFALLCTLTAAVIVFGVRWFGPHDLYEKDQPKTMAYTADMVTHGRFALPRDVIYQPATKPPMYNWIGAAAVFVSGNWSEWTLKLPTILGTVATAGVVCAVAKRRSGSVVALLAVGIFFSFGSDIRHGSVLRLSYLARPDMLVTAFCTAAWFCFAIAVEKPSAKTAFTPAIVGWFCVTAAALTKGPLAALPAIFGIVYALLTPPPRSDLPLRQEGRFTAVGRLWLHVGLPIVVLGFGAWVFAAARQDWSHVRDVMWGAEVAGRLTETPEGFAKPPYYAVMWFVTKAQPWGGVALLAMAFVAWQPRLRRTAGPAALYLAIVLLGLSLPAAKRMDYLLPAYAPAAVLIAVAAADVVRHRILGAFAVLAVPLLVAAVFVTTNHRPVDFAVPAIVALAAGVFLVIERKRPVPVAVLAIVPVVLVGLLGKAQLTKSLEAKGHWSDRAVAFTKALRKAVRPEQSLVIINRGKHPLLTLLGRHQGSYLTPADLKNAEWVVLPEQPDLSPILLSDPLPEGFAEVENRPLVRLGLYRNVPLDRLIAAQKACADWSPVENPYHAAGTVYRDE
ncbi:MAG: hypothetical protein QM754_14370 [Tepidisphaeraceae bacterium]